MIIRNPPHNGEDFKKGYENDYYLLYFNLLHILFKHFNFIFLNCFCLSIFLDIHIKKFYLYYALC